MRVVKPAGSPDVAAEARLAAETRLAAEMLCLEHGARAVGPDLQALPAPHAPWPVVEIPPLTAGGSACHVHYKPSVGVVYYTEGAGFCIASLVARLAAAIARSSRGYAHLCDDSRAVASAPATVGLLRSRCRVSREYVTGPAAEIASERLPARAHVPARLLTWTPLNDLDCPLYYSSRVAFTWVFMPVTVAIAAEGRPFNSMEAVNAAVSAVFYDDGRASSLADGADVRTVALSHFGRARAPLPRRLTAPPAPPAAEPPPPAAEPPLIAPDALDKLLNIGGPRPGGGGALLATPDGRLTFVGNTPALHGERPGRAAALSALPAQEWAPERFYLAGGRLAVPGGATSRGFQCVNCEAPLSGEVVTVTPPAGRRPGYLEQPCGFLVCLFCWLGAGAPTADLTQCKMLDCGRTTVPFTQAETAAACPGFKRLALLLASTAAPLEGADGAFVVRLPADGPDDKNNSFILAGETLGPRPEITNFSVANSELSTIHSARLVTARQLKGT